MSPSPRLSAQEIASRLTAFESLKRDTPVAIYGSFFRSRKDDLITLRGYLRSPPLRYNARISEDLDDNPRPGRRSVWDRTLSERLIDESDLHIFIMPRRREGEPDTMIQSVSMELERLNTLIECGIKQDQAIAVFFEQGLMDLAGWGFGSVCRGLLENQTGIWTIGQFRCIEDIFAEARSFCWQAIVGRSKTDESA